MGSLSFGHWVVVFVVALLLFGRGRISETMGEFGKGIRSFRLGLAEDGVTEPASAQNSESARSVGSESEPVQGKPE